MDIVQQVAIRDAILDLATAIEPHRTYEESSADSQVEDATYRLDQLLGTLGIFAGDAIQEALVILRQRWKDEGR